MVPRGSLRFGRKVTSQGEERKRMKRERRRGQISGGFTGFNVWGARHQAGRRKDTEDAREEAMTDFRWFHAVLRFERKVTSQGEGRKR